MQDVTNMMLGIDATHLTEVGAFVQDGAKTLPAMTFLQGSANGGGAVSPDLKVLAADLGAKKFVDYGTHASGGSYDRVMYSNYLGGNPGNQGRNFAGGICVKNPFAGQNGSTAKYLLLHAMTGKDPADTAHPELKPSSYLTIMPMLNPQAEPPPPPGMPAASQGANGVGGGQNSAPQPGDPGMPATAGTPGTFSGGCALASAPHGSARPLVPLLALLALTIVVRRRRA
jgi:hypothetical protein